MKQISVGPSDEEPSTDKKSSSFDATRRFARIRVHAQVGIDLFSIADCNSESTRSGFLVWHGKCVISFEFERSSRAPLTMVCCHCPSDIQDLRIRPIYLIARKHVKS